MSRITYNSIDIISGQPTPYVSRVDQPYTDGTSQKIGQTEIYVLAGQITGCSFWDATGAMELVTSAFASDFHTLKLLDDDGYTVEISGVKVNSVQFPQSIQVGVVDYSVELESRPPSYFKNIGILEKKNDWSVSQDEEGNFSINRSIYAKGINTAPEFNNALENAKNFVLTLTGFNPPPLFPFFITGFSGSLDTRTEQINRLEGTYSINESYISSTGKVTQMITTTLDSGNDGVLSVVVNGELKLGKAEDFTLLRSAYSGIAVYDLATGVYDAYRGTSGLMVIPLSSGVDEN